MAKSLEAAFARVWKVRDSSLYRLAGVVEFRRLNGKSFPDDGHTLYASHTSWKTETDVAAWTQSEAFRKAQRHAGGIRPLHKAAPVFAGFKTVAGA